MRSRVVAVLALVVVVGWWALWEATPSLSDPNALAVRLPATGLVFGSESAPVTLVEFCSFDCPICAQLHTSLYPEVLVPRIISGQVRVRYVDLSISHEGAEKLAFVECASSRDAGIDAIRAAHRLDIAAPGPPQSERPPDKERNCPSIPEQERRRAAEHDRVEQAGIHGTPTILIGYERRAGEYIGWPILGLPPADSLATIIDSASTLLRRPPMGRSALRVLRKPFVGSR